MDLNDPRRRLMVQRQSSPSLRVQAAPKPVRVPAVVPQTNNLRVNPATVPKDYQPPAPQPEDNRNILSKVGGAIFGNTAKFLNTTYAGARGAYDTAGLLISKPFDSDAETQRKVNETAARLDRNLKRGGIFGQGSAFSGYEDAGDISAGDLTKRVAGDALKTAPEVLPFVRGAQVATGASKLVNGRLVLPAFKTVAPRLAAEGLAYTGLDATGRLIKGDEITAKGTLLDAIVNTSMNVAIPGLGRLVSKFRGGTEGATSRLISKLSKTDDPEKVSAILRRAAPDLDAAVLDDVSRYIAKEDTPDAITNVLQAIEPNNLDLAPGVYNATSPHPGNVPEGYDVPLDPTTPNKSIDDIEFEKARRAALQEAGVNETAIDDVAQDLRFETNVKKNADELAKDPKLANEIASVTSKDAPDSLNAAMKIIAGKDSKRQIKDMLFGENGLLKDIDMNQSSKNRLIKDLVGETDPQNVSKRISAKIKEAQEATVTDTAESIARAADSNVDETVKTLSDANIAPTEAVSTPADTNIGQEVSKTADEALKGQKVEDMFPGVTNPEDRRAIQEVLDSLDSAKSEYRKADKIRSKEKAQRIAQGKSAYEAAGGGEAGVQAKLKSLKGGYSKSGFDAIDASPETQKSILDMVEKSDLRDFEKLNTQQAFRKIWGATEGKPTPSDINYIRRFAGDELADAVQEAVEQGGRDWKERLVQAAGTPRALMATGDFSFGFRQGAPIGTRFPKEWAKANKESVKYAFNKNYFEKEMKKIAQSKYFTAMDEKMKLGLTGASDSLEERFATADYAEAIPGFGRIVTGSDRAYTGGLTKLRYDTAKKIIDSYGGVDEFLDFYKGKDDAMEALGEVINTFTGRGGKRGGLADKHMKTLSATLFAPRLWAAKLNSLNPVWYAKMAKRNPQAAKLALQTQAAFLTTAGTVLSLAAAGGATVVWDPRSADFAKIKIGNTRYDILGGLQQNIRLMAQLITGEKINSNTGELQGLGDGFASPTRYDILLQAFENKENPLLSMATAMLKGKDFQGNPVNPVNEALGRLIPLSVQGAYETAKDIGSIPKGIALNLPSFVGVGVQTYGNQPTKDFKDGKFTGKIEENMVTDKNGEVILDEKGKPVKVDFPEDATDLEKKALLDNKRTTALRAQYKSTLSGEDQALLKLSKKELEGYVSDGQISQDKFDELMRHQKALDNIEGVEIPKGTVDPLSRAFYTKYNSMTEPDQANYLSGEADENSKTLTRLLNEQRVDGLPEFKPSNKLAKLYAEYEKKINTTEMSEIDKRNEAISFQKSAYKLNFSDNANEIYTEGSSSDLRYLIDNGDITQADLDEAIKLDNDMYNAGLTSKLKFSKKFRREYGYSSPGGSGGSGGSGSRRTGINQLLPSFRSSGSQSAPQFSSRPRGIKFKKPDVSTGSTPSKRVKINL